MNEKNQETENLIKKIDEKMNALIEERKKELINKDGDLTKDEQIELGKLLLNCNSNNIQTIDLSEKNPNLNATYVCIKDRGGNAVIVNSNKEYLTATSSVNFENHVQEFINGRRTNK